MIAHIDSHRGNVDWRMCQLGFPDWWTTMPIPRVLSLMWHDILSEIPPEQRDEYIGRLNEPLTDREADVEVLQQLVDIGQAVDLDDAREWFAHQQRISGLEPQAKAAANFEFAARRRARLAE